LDRLQALSLEVSPETLLLWLGSEVTVASLSDELRISSGRISDIIRAVKSYSHLDQALVQEVDVHEGLEDTLVILNHKLKDGVTVHRHYTPDLPHVEALAGEINQVWTNLIDNAIDAMHGRGDLTLRTFAHDGEVVVEIADSGPGIPPEVRDRVFEAFFTTKEPGQGTGLGLYLAYNIVVNRHRGRIGFESRPGDTCFRVELPLRMRRSDA
jgi:signal transduction histidine kinase